MKQQVQYSSVKIFFGYLWLFIQAWQLEEKIRPNLQNHLSELYRLDFFFMHLLHSLFWLKFIFSPPTSLHHRRIMKIHKYQLHIQMHIYMYLKLLCPIVMVYFPKNTKKLSTQSMQGNGCMHVQVIFFIHICILDILNGPWLLLAV